MVVVIPWLIAKSWYVGALFALIALIWFLRHPKFFIYKLQYNNSSITTLH